jgi:GTP cyclohydrolase IA
MRTIPSIPACDVANGIESILRYIGEDPTRDGLKDTASRVLRSYGEIFSGYQFTPEKIAGLFTVFEADHEEVVLLKNIEFYSTCEHHMQPFFGNAHIAYIPNGKVVGVSKLVRVLEVYARRLQIQERLCQQVTSALMTHLNPMGAACILEAKHFCMVCRGVNKQNCQMVTSSLQGAFRTDAATRQELMSLLK